MVVLSRRSALADIHRMKALAAMTDEDYRALLSGFGVESAKDLDGDGLQAVRRALRNIVEPKTKNERRMKRGEDLVKWRRMVYGVIGKWLKDCGYQNDSCAIRTVACRAAHRDEFNDITLSQLKQLYHSWKHKCEIAQEVAAMKQMLEPICMN